MMFTFEDKKHGHSFMVAHDAILMLANSQGFYGRILRDMEDQNWEPLYELTKNHHFEDTLDFVMFVEC